MKSLSALNSLSTTNTYTASYQVILFASKELKFSFPNVVLKKAEPLQVTLYNYVL